MSTRFAKFDLRGVDHDPMKLHPVMRAAVHEVEMMCLAECLPFRMYEGFRSPQRQDWLYSQGRMKTRPGKIVTEHQAWDSYHQFGLAADFGMVINNEWHFDVDPANDHLWRRLLEIGEFYGLESNQTPFSWLQDYDGQRGYLQYATLEIPQLRAGKYPGGGDSSWENNLRRALESYPVESASRRASESVAPCPTQRLSR